MKMGEFTNAQQSVETAEQNKIELLLKDLEINTELTRRKEQV